MLAPSLCAILPIICEYSTIKMYNSLFNTKVSKFYLVSEGTCKGDRPEQVIFAKRAKDYILTGRIVASKLVSSDQECQMQCILSMKCDMFNLGPLDDSFRHTCQILRFDFKNYVVQRKKGWSFRARKVTGFVRWFS